MQIRSQSQSPRTFEYDKLSKKILHELDIKFEELHTNFKCILDKQTEEILHLKNLLIETLDMIGIKTAENFSLKNNPLHL